jgi:phage terminase Nu1 subunit (DNA packaging protein)
MKALKEEYKRLIPHLSIEKVEVKEVTTKEYDQLLKELRKKDKKQKQTDAKVDKLEAMVKSLLEKQLKE